MIKNYRHGECCSNCEYFIAYVKEADKCALHGVRIAITSKCDDFKLQEL